MKLINKLSFFNLGCEKQITIHKDRVGAYFVQFSFIEDDERKVIIQERYTTYSIANARFLDIKNQWFA